MDMAETSPATLARGWLRRPGGPFSGVEDEQWQSGAWQVRHRFMDADAVARLLGAGAADRARARRVSQDLPFSVSPYYLELCRPGDPRDPIARQLLPFAGELNGFDDPGHPEDVDPFRERALSPVEGIVHRYPDRVLLVLTNFCSTLCRHCMRKREWRSGFRRLSDGALERAVAYIAARPEIRDVLVTGGDPLELSPALLGRVLGPLRRLEHLDVIRIGSRVPVTIPQRIGGSLLEVLSRHAPLWLNTQFNHPRELTPESRAACRRLGSAGVLLGNQSVLLRGVNDDAETLIELSRGLLRAGIRPYYLHHCDPVGGLDRLRVPLEEGREIVRSLHGRLTGFAIPRYTVDLPGGRGKVPVDLGFDRGSGQFESPLDGESVIAP